MSHCICCVLGACPCSSGIHRDSPGPAAYAVNEGLTVRYGGSCKLTSRAVPERLYISKLHAESQVGCCWAVYLRSLLHCARRYMCAAAALVLRYNIAFDVCIAQPNLKLCCRLLLLLAMQAGLDSPGPAAYGDSSSSGTQKKSSSSNRSPSKRPPTSGFSFGCGGRPEIAKIEF
jgi:hypothetical protein